LETVAQPRVIVLSRAGQQSVSDDLRRQLDEVAEVRFVVCGHSTDPNAAAALLEEAQVLAATNISLPVLTDALLDRCPGLRHVVVYATGHEYVDAELLARRGVTLSVLPHYATNAVAEHALALLLALSCRVHLANDRSRGLTSTDVSLRGVELTDRVAGVIGVGRIGGRLIELLRGLGVAVVGHDTDPAAVATAVEAGVEMVPLATLLRASDLVAVTASTIAGQPAILGRQELLQLPHGAFVVNVGRAALVDTGAMVAAVRLGLVRGYAVDDIVLDPAEHADLLSQGRILQTAHSAWWKDEALARGSVMFGEAILAAVRGRPVDVVATRPAVLPR
jgi:phosphoglycerate dehydrogenase-like enzyme